MDISIDRELRCKEGVPLSLCIKHMFIRGQTYTYNKHVALAKYQKGKMLFWYMYMKLECNHDSTSMSLKYHLFFFRDIITSTVYIESS